LGTLATNLPDATPPLLGADTASFLAFSAAMVAASASRPLQSAVFDGFAVRDALGKVRKRHAVASAIFLGKWANLERIVGQLGHGHAPSMISMDSRMSMGSIGR
jgi:hypothetical protein